MPSTRNTNLEMYKRLLRQSRIHVKILVKQNRDYRKHLCFYKRCPARRGNMIE